MKCNLMKSEPDEKRKLDNIIIFFIFFIFGAVRLIWAYSHSIWLDEGYIFWLCRNPLNYIIENMTFEPHPPFYFIFMHFWLLLGKSVIWIRLPSVAFSLLSAYFLYLIAKDFVNKKTAILCVFLYSLNPDMLYTEIQARMYSLLILAVISCTYFALKYIQNNKEKYLWLFSVSAIIGLLTHYFFIFVFIPISVFLFLKSKNKFKIILSILVVLVLTSFWSYFFFLQCFGKSLNTVEKPETVITSNLQKISLIINNTFFAFKSYPDIFKWFNWYFMLIGYIIPLIAGLLYLKNNYKSILALFLSIIFFTMLCVCFFSLFSGSELLFRTRYNCFLWPFLLLIFSSGFVSLLTYLKGVLKYSAVVVLTVMLLLGAIIFYQGINNPYYWLQNWKEASKIIEENENPKNDVIIFTHLLSFMTFNYYYKDWALYADFNPNDKTWDIQFPENYLRRRGLVQILAGEDANSWGYIFNRINSGSRIWFISGQNANEEIEFAKWILQRTKFIKGLVLDSFEPFYSIKITCCQKP